MSGLTNKYVEDFGMKHCDNFLGVFPCNIYPDVKKLNFFSIIFNESKHDEDGTHFVCVYSDKNFFYYFDSLGLKLENIYILNFINKNLNGKKMIENKTQIQSYDSIFCGYFCLSFIIYMSSKMNIKKYYKFFSTENLKINDKIVVELLVKLSTLYCK